MAKTLKVVLYLLVSFVQRWIFADQKDVLWFGAHVLNKFSDETLSGVDFNILVKLRMND